MLHPLWIGIIGLFLSHAMVAYVLRRPISFRGGVALLILGTVSAFVLFLAWCWLDWLEWGLDHRERVAMLSRERLEQVRVVGADGKAGILRLAIPDGSRGEYAFNLWFPPRPISPFAAVVSALVLVPSWILGAFHILRSRRSAASQDGTVC